MSKKRKAARASEDKKGAPRENLWTRQGKKEKKKEVEENRTKRKRIQERSRDRYDLIVTQQDA